MGNGIMEWIIGPQVVGLIFLIAGTVQRIYPPRKINKYYGYRMPSATKNQQTWDAANRYSARIIIRTGIVLLVAGLLFTWLMNVITMPDRIRFALSYLVLLVASMGGAIAIILSTEQHLEKNYDDKQL